MTPKRVTYSQRSNHAARAAHARGARHFKTYDTSYIRPKQSKGLSAAGFDVCKPEDIYVVD